MAASRALFALPLRRISTCRRSLESPKSQLRSIPRTFTSSTRLLAYEHLQDELPKRRPPVIYDDLTPVHSHYLSVSLASFLPPSWTRSPLSLPTRGAEDDLILPPAHHLVYFNPAIQADKLLPDGTDPLQSPGEPFVRRMWAGGSVRWNPSHKITLDGSRWACVEGIRDVTVKGKEGSEKIFVGIERRFGPTCTAATNAKNGQDEQERSRLWTDTEEAFGNAALVERRNIVFMRERSPEQAAQDNALAKEKQLKPQHEAEFTHTLTPNPNLLFRYSALTFNAHSIHLDPGYCREIEGHRDMLVHGPMTFTFLVTMLQNRLRESRGGRLQSIEYRNLAPLYCGEPLKLCGRKREKGVYELWAETPEGGIAVKGTARTG